MKQNERQRRNCISQVTSRGYFAVVSQTSSNRQGIVVHIDDISRLETIDSPGPHPPLKSTSIFRGNTRTRCSSSARTITSLATSLDSPHTTRVVSATSIVCNREPPREQPPVTTESRARARARVPRGYRVIYLPTLLGGRVNIYIRRSRRRQLRGGGHDKIHAGKKRDDARNGPSEFR